MRSNVLSTILVFALLNSCIELEISAPSFPDIIMHFYLSQSDVGRTITYNLIGFCIGSLILGPLSDHYGRRKTMLWGNGILMIGAVGCVISSSFNMLLIARLLQGIGASTSAVIVSAIIADVYPLSKAERLYGVMNAIFTLCMAISPIMGGLLNETVGWRGNYGVVAVISISSWVLLYFFLPETKEKFEPLSFGKLVFHYNKMVFNSSFLRAATIPSLLYGCYLTFVSLAPFMYMKTFGTSAYIYILNQSIIIAAFAFTSAVSHKITFLVGPSKAVDLGLGLSILGSMLMLFSNESYYVLTAAMCLFCSGSAILYPIIFAHSLEIFPNHKGIASSLIISLRYLLCSCLTGLINYFYNDDIINFYLSILILTAIITILSKDLTHDLNLK